MGTPYKVANGYKICEKKEKKRLVPLYRPPTWANPRWPPFFVKIVDIGYKINYILKSYDGICIIFSQCVHNITAHMPAKFENDTSTHSCKNPIWRPFFLHFVFRNMEKKIYLKKLSLYWFNFFTVSPQCAYTHVCKVSSHSDNIYSCKATFTCDVIYQILCENWLLNECTKKIALGV